MDRITRPKTLLKVPMARKSRDLLILLKRGISKTATRVASRKIFFLVKPDSYTRLSVPPTANPRRPAQSPSPHPPPGRDAYDTVRDLNSNSRYITKTVRTVQRASLSTPPQTSTMFVKRSPASGKTSITEACESSSDTTYASRTSNGHHGNSVITCTGE